MAEPTGTPTPIPTPTAIWLLLGRALRDEVLRVAADEGESSDNIDDVEDVRTEGLIEDGSTEGLAERERRSPWELCLLGSAQGSSV